MTFEGKIQNPADPNRPPETLINFKPSIIVLSGRPLTGKGTLARRMAAGTNIGIIDVDEIREEIDETRKLDPTQRWLPPEQEKAIMISSYTVLCERALERALTGHPVIITGTFSRAEFKTPLEQLYKVTQEKNIPFRAFLLTAEDESIPERIRRRREEGSPSNVDTLEKYQWSGTIFSPITFAPLTEVRSEDPTYVDQVLTNLDDLKAA